MRCKQERMIRDDESRPLFYGLGGVEFLKKAIKLGDFYFK